jgi:hypothetical protein
VRLRTCVAIELGVGATVAAVVGTAALWAGAEVRASFAGVAEAAEARQPTRLSPVLPRVIDARSPAERAAAMGSPAARGMFLGQADEVLLAPLTTSDIASVKFNRGGSSLSLRIDFADGARAAFKPDQINLQTVPRKEVAAFRINRLLGMSSVPPAIGRRFELADIRAHLRPDNVGQWPRFAAEVIRDRDGVVGELSWWIPVIKDATVDGYPIDSTDGVVTWKRYLQVGAEIPPADLELTAQISELVLFDYVINNPDRWSGNNTKVSEDRRTLYFMDNAMAFGEDPRGHSRARTYFERSQKFSRRLVSRLRLLRAADVRRAIDFDVEPFDYLLSDGEIEAMLARRDLALASIDGLIAEYGADQVLVFP